MNRIELRSWRRTFLWMAGCSLLFSALYNLCNWITTRRADVGTWAFAWELRIPFVPWMIVPYWSLDLFFIGSFFLCTSRRELDVLGKRLVLATLVAAGCFLALPLTTRFPRPAVDGVYGFLFGLLRSFDQPHNLFPSLHIAFRTLLADHYARHTKGWQRGLVHAWFSLIGLSTILTYQHQVMDILGGFLLAAICFHAFRVETTAAPRARNVTVGWRYALSAAILVSAAWYFRPWGMWLLWPATVLGWVAAGYFGLGASVYRKAEGRLPLSTRILFAPVLVGHWLSFRFYRRQCRSWDEVAPGLWIGRRLSDAEARAAIAQGVVAVLDLTAESSEAAPFLALPYKNMPVLDLTAPSQAQLEDGVAFIQEYSNLGTVYVHCKIGYSRSAALAAAYLLSTGLGRNPEDAFQRLREIRPSIVIRPEIRSALMDFHQEARGSLVS
jgi:membrane-associated phospholipid phosphatase